MLEGWEEHLRPFCEKILIPGSSRQGFRVKSVPFQAFVQHFIDVDGNLRDEKGDVRRDLVFAFLSKQ